MPRPARPSLIQLAPWWLLALALVLVSYALLLPFLPEPTTVTAELIHGTVWALRSGLGSGLLWWASRRPDLPPTLRRALLLASAIAAGWTLFRLIGLVDALTGWESFPASVEIDWTLFSRLLTLVVFAGIPRAPFDRRDWASLALDLLVSVGGIGALLWILVTIPLAGVTTGLPQRQVIVYGLAQVALLGGLNVVAQRALALPSRRAIGWFLVGEAGFLPTLLLTQYGKSILAVAGTFGWVIYFLSAIPTLLAALAYRHDELPVGPAGPGLQGRLYLNFLPFLSPVLIGGFLVGTALQGPSARVLPLAALLTAVTLLLVLSLLHSSWRQMALQQEELQREQRRQQARLSGIGRLAGSVAHEFNNLTMGIVGYAGLGLHVLPEGAPARQYFSRIEDTGFRAAALTARLLQIGGEQFERMERTELRPWLLEVVARLQAGAPGGLEYGVAAEEGLTTSMNREEMEQVIRELAANGAEAQGQRGPIRVGLSAQVLTTALETPFLAVPPGRYAVLEVSDNGRGIQPGDLHHVFDPFFTHQPLHLSAGLGLAAVYGIAVAHRGGLAIESMPGMGTTVRVYLPLNEA